MTIWVHGEPSPREVQPPYIVTHTIPGTIGFSINHYIAGQGTYQERVSSVEDNGDISSYDIPMKLYDGAGNLVPEDQPAILWIKNPIGSGIPTEDFIECEGDWINGIWTPYNGVGKIQVTASPTEGYVFSHWLFGNVGETPSNAGSNPVFNFVFSPGVKVLQAVFTRNSFTITVTQSVHGTISPSTSTVNAGGNKTFTITADSGYYIANVVVDGESKGAVYSWTFSNVQADHSIYATFASDVSPPDSFTITVSQSENGVISPGTTTVAENEDAHFAITPDEGYVVEDVLVDGEPQGAISSYTFYNVASNHTLSATFKKTSVPSTPNYVPAVAVGIGLVCSALIIRKLT